MQRTWTEVIVDAYYAAAKWWHPDWWRYLFAPVTRGWLGYRWYHRPLGYLNAIWCRYRDHPAGVFWFNAGGYEPDMTCRGCGDDLA